MNVTQRLGTALITGVLSLSLVSAALAQGGGGRRAPGLLAPPIVARLNLDADQKAKVQTAGEAYTKAVQDANALTTPKEKRQASRKARQDYEAAVKAALNADQQKQLEAFQAEAKELTGMMGPAGNQMVGLNLTAEQKTKVKEISDKYAGDRQKLQAELKAATDKKAVQTQIQELNKKMMTEVREILTADQRKLLQPGVGRRKKQQ